MSAGALRYCKQNCHWQPSQNMFWEAMTIFICTCMHFRTINMLRPEGAAARLVVPGGAHGHEAPVALGRLPGAVAVVRPAPDDEVTPCATTSCSAGSSTHLQTYDEPMDTPPNDIPTHPKRFDICLWFDHRQQHVKSFVVSSSYPRMLHNPGCHAESC